MIRLSRAYSIASFLGIAIIAVALTWFYRSSSRAPTSAAGG